MRPYEVVQSIQAQYASLGRIVYDRRDRWALEHSMCQSFDHQLKMESGVVVTACVPTSSVLVLDTGTVMHRSRCTRCLDNIGLNEIAEFLENDHLCPTCVEIVRAAHPETV